MEELLGTPEAARRLGVSTDRIRQWIREGRLPAIRVGRDWVVPGAAVTRFVRRPPGRPPLPDRPA
jgi:excisionase family DNA binding protein